MLSLTVEKRDMKVRADAVRASGRLPAIFYGPKVGSTAVSVSMPEFLKVWKKAGESSVIALKEASGKDEHEALIYEVDVHPTTGVPRHADFYVIEKGKKVKVRVPLIFSGVSPAVKDKGAILVKVMRDMEIEAAPKDLPREIAVDISMLIEFNDAIHAKDIVLPTGVELKAKPDEVVASVAEAKEEVIEAPAAIDMSAIEVEAKGKELKEGEEGAVSGGAATPAGKGGEAKPAAEAKKPEKK